MEHIVITSTAGIRTAAELGEKQVLLKRVQFKELEAKMERLEERLVEEEIELEPYRKYHKKFRIEKALLQEEILHYGSSFETKLAHQLAILPYLDRCSRPF